MRYVVTGGSGFTGFYLCRALTNYGNQIVVFDQQKPSAELESQVHFVQGDVCSENDLQRLNLAPGDVVFHLAARQFHGEVPARGRDAWFADVNARGTRAVIDAMRKGGTTDIIFFSTDMTYGRPQYTPVPANHPQNPIGPYGKSKKQAEQALLAAHEKYGLRCTIFRPRLIAGAGRLGILVKLFKLVRFGLPVPMIGSGRNRYQMVAVEDCVRAAILAMENGFPTGPFNLGSDAPPTVRELLGELIRRTGSHSILVPTPARPLQCALQCMDALGMPLLYPEQFAIADVDYILDTSKTRTALQWAPSRQDADIIFDAYRQCWNR
jgi:dTDP-glucose 4,6-dehydratase